MEKKLLLMKSFLQTCFFSLRLQKNLAIGVSILSIMSMFDFLFYSSVDFLFGPGLNVLLFSFIYTLLVLVVHQPSMNNRLFWWSTLGVLLSSINCTYQSDPWSISMLFLSHCIMVGSLHSDNLKNVLKSLLQFIVLQVCMPISTFFFLLDPKGWSSHSINKLGRYVKLSIIPLALISVFTFLYSNASSQFNDFIINPIISMFDISQPFISVERFILWSIASVIILPLLIPPLKGIIMKSEKFENILKRNKKADVFKHYPNGLNNELRIGIISMISLNVMVFLFNALDLVYVWFSQSAKSPVELSQYVHNGTNMTILSTAIGALVIILFFRKNINFHPKNQRLKMLAKAWIIQNTILSISTLMRNAQYISEYGLTHKRLGVIIFIALTVVGLLFTYQKVHEKHSFTYFFNRLTLSFFLILLSYSVIDHESLVIYHAANIQKGHVDMEYLSRMSDNHNFIFAKYQHELEAKSKYKLHFCEIDQYDNFFYTDSNWRSFQWLRYKNENTKMSLSVNGNFIYNYKNPNPCNLVDPLIQKNNSLDLLKVDAEDAVENNDAVDAKSEPSISETVKTRGLR